MLLLARSFDLQKILKGHRLLLLMVKEKRNLSEMYKELAEQDALSGFPPSDSDSEDDREHQCSACRKTRKRVCCLIAQLCFAMLPDCTALACYAALLHSSVLLLHSSVLLCSLVAQPMFCHAPMA